MRTINKNLNKMCKDAKINQKGYKVVTHNKRMKLYSIGSLIMFNNITTLFDSQCLFIKVSEKCSVFSKM